MPKSDSRLDGLMSAFGMGEPQAEKSPSKSKGLDSAFFAPPKKEDLPPSFQSSPFKHEQPFTQKFTRPNFEVTPSPLARPAAEEMERTSGANLALSPVVDPLHRNVEPTLEVMNDRMFGPKQLTAVPVQAPAAPSQIAVNEVPTLVDIFSAAAKVPVVNTVTPAGVQPGREAGDVAATLSGAKGYPVIYEGGKALLDIPDAKHPLNQAEEGLTKVISGGMEAATPLLLHAAVMKPLQTGLGVVAGMGLDKAGKETAKALGADEQTQQFVGTAAGFLPMLYGPYRTFKDTGKAKALTEMESAIAERLKAQGIEASPEAVQARAKLFSKASTKDINDTLKAVRRGELDDNLRGAFTTETPSEVTPEVPNEPTSLVFEESGVAKPAVRPSQVQGVGTAAATIPNSVLGGKAPKGTATERAQALAEATAREQVGSVGNTVPSSLFRNRQRGAVRPDIFSLPIEQTAQALKTTEGQLGSAAGEKLLYHGTDDVSAEQILKSGKLGNGKTPTHLTRDIETARAYARLASDRTGRPGEGRVFAVRESDVHPDLLDGDVRRSGVRETVLPPEWSVPTSEYRGSLAAGQEIKPPYSHAERAMRDLVNAGMENVKRIPEYDVYNGDAVIQFDAPGVGTTFTRKAKDITPQSIPQIIAEKGVLNNASGESSASMEALNRVSSEKRNGISRVRIDTRSGNEVPLVGVDAVDAKPGKYDVIVQRSQNGEMTLDRGSLARASWPTKQRIQNATQPVQSLVAKTLSGADNPANGRRISQGTGIGLPQTESSGASGVRGNLANAGAGRSAEGAIESSISRPVGLGQRGAIGTSRQRGAVRPDIFTAPIEATAKSLKTKEGRLGVAASTLTLLPDEKYAGNINLERLNTADDVINLIKQTAEANKETIDKQRRGKMSHEETAALAEELGMTPESLAKMKPGKALNAEQLLAARRINVATAEKVRAAAKAFQENDSTDNLLAFQQALQEHAAVLHSVSGATAEAGRALSQFRIMAQALRSKDVSNHEKVLEVLGEKGKEVTEELAKKLAEIPDDDIVGLNKFLRNATEFTTADKVSAYWTANVLSGPRTHIRNLVGNTLFGLVQFPVRITRGLADIPLSKIGGRQREYYASEAVPAAVGFLGGMPDGLRRAAFIIKNGFDVSDSSKLEMPFNYEFAGGAKNPWNWPGRYLVAADAMAKTMSLQSELWAIASRQAMREGLKGRGAWNRIYEMVASPTPEMMNKAIEFSRYATFNSRPDKVSSAMIRLRETELGNTGIKPMRFVIPFVNTPWNITKTGFEYSPAGLLKLASTGVKSPEAADVVGKAIIGSMTMAGLASIAADGRLTGAAPSDPGEREAFFRQGKQPFSVKIGNRWVQYNQTTGPLSLAMAATAAFHDAFAQRGQVPTSDRISEAAGVIGNSIVDQSFFRGLENLMNAISEPKQYMSKAASDTASGFIPFSGMQRNVANAIDPTLKDAEGMYERLISGVPILSKQVPAKLDTFGREQKMEGGEGLLALLPSRIPKDEPKSTVDAELTRLGLYPTPAGDTIEGLFRTFKLTRDEKRELQRETGQAMFSMLDNLFSSEEYQKAPDEIKRQLAQRLIAQSRDLGRLPFKVKAMQGEFKEKPKTVHPSLIPSAQQ